VAEDRGADRARDKADRIDAEGLQSPDQRIDAGKYSLAKTRPVTVLYRKKSYHSIVVPIVLAITARRSCTRCSSAESTPVAVPATVIKAPPPALPEAVFYR
jgi:hypothetical protein